MCKSFAIDEKRNSARLFAKYCVKGDLDDHLAGGSLEGAVEQLEEADEQLAGVDGQLEGGDGL